MRELNFVGPGKVEWREVPAPVIDGPGQALVRPIAVATCDLDTLLLRGEAPMFGGGFPLGHESVGVVVEVGDEVTAFKPGDRVVPSFQISCGSCERCRRGLTGNCERVRGTAMYGIGARGGNFGGALSDLMKIPYADAMLVAMPEGLAAADVASAADNIPDAWRTVAPMLRDNPGAPVLIVGGGSIGLYAIPDRTRVRRVASRLRRHRCRPLEIGGGTRCVGTRGATTQADGAVSDHGSGMRDAGGIAMRDTLDGAGRNLHQLRNSSGRDDADAAVRHVHYRDDVRDRPGESANGDSRGAGIGAHGQDPAGARHEQSRWLGRRDSGAARRADQAGNRARVV